jgi:hypothetical protein
MRHSGSNNGQQKIQVTLAASLALVLTCGIPAPGDARPSKKTTTRRVRQARENYGLTFLRKAKGIHARERIRKDGSRAKRWFDALSRVVAEEFFDGKGSRHIRLTLPGRFPMEIREARMEGPGGAIQIQRTTRRTGRSRLVVEESVVVNAPADLLSLLKKQVEAPLDLGNPLYGIKGEKDDGFFQYGPNSITHQRRALAYEGPQRENGKTGKQVK